LPLTHGEQKVINSLADLDDYKSPADVKQPLINLSSVLPAMNMQYLESKALVKTYEDDELQAIYQTTVDTKGKKKQIGECGSSQRQSRCFTGSNSGSRTGQV
jgi:hypothetical protein